MKDVFLNGNFFSLWLGQVVAQFGERLTQMALIGLLYDQHQVGTQDMSLLLVFMVLPVFLLNPIVGVCVDVWDRKKTMIISDCVRAVLLLLLPSLLWAFPPSGPWGFSPMYVMVFLIFAAARFFVPAKSAMIPEIMDAKDLRTANSLSATSKMVATVLGVLGGGFMVTALGAATCFYVNGLCFLVSAFSLAFVRRRHVLIRPKVKDASLWRTCVNIFKDLKEVLQAIRHHDEMMYLVSILSVLMLAGGAIFVTFPVFVHMHYGADTHGFSMLVSSLGLGLFAGAVMLGRFHGVDNHKYMLSMSLLMMALLFFIFAIIKSFMWAVVLMFLIGLTGAPVIICTETMLQMIVGTDKIGRVYTCVEIVIHAVFMLSMASVGYLGKFWDTGVLLVLSVALSTAVFVMVMLSHWRGRRVRA